MWHKIESIEDFPEEGEYLIETYEGDHYVSDLNMDGEWMYNNVSITELVCRYMEIPEE